MTFLSLFVVGIVSLTWLTYFCLMRRSDYMTYKSFLDKSKEVTAYTSTAKQKRQGVSKDIWFTQADKTRLHYRIQSEASLLTLVPKDDKVDLIENLEKIKCWMQDKLYTTTPENKLMQQMRFFEASEGTYHYSLQQFIANTVSISLFRLPGSDLPLVFNPNDAFLKGVAQDVSFSVSGTTPQFQAEHFRATLNKRPE